MNVLGLGGSNHDFSACLLQNGRPVVAVEDERLQRIKHAEGEWDSKPAACAANYCLETADVSAEDLDAAFGNLDLDGVGAGLPGLQVETVGHHAAHAAASFLTSPVDQAALLVIDGCGGPILRNGTHDLLETISIGHGNSKSVAIQTLQSGKKPLSSTNWTYRCQNSLGTLYELVTEAIGFGEFGEGKTMGLAAYGDDTLYRELRDFVDIREPAGFYFDPYCGISDWLARKLIDGKNSFSVRARIASAVQAVFEEAVVWTAKLCHRETGLDYLAYGGGCALNAVANERIITETGFKEVFVFPAAGDNGLSVGAALLGSLNLSRERQWSPTRSEWARVAFLGTSYGEEDCLNALENTSVFYRRARPDRVTEMVQRLSAGQVIAEFRGRSEVGPRALGHRSIFADPRSARTRDLINLRIKSRESFRPLAPMVPQEVAEKFFNYDRENPFMLAVAPIRARYRDELAAVCHEDGTARLQTVREDSDPFLHKLLHRFGERTGIPILLNTSFNSRGVPIVETPEDALNCFLSTRIDALFIEDYVAEKHTPWAERPLH